EEIQFHHDMKRQELERSGVNPDDSGAATSRAMGNIGLARQDARAVWIWPVLDQLARDARIGARMLLKAPVFTIFAILVLSVGIGANVTVFSYLNAMFLRPLDVPDPGRFMRIYGDGEGPNGVISYDAYEKYRDGNQSFSSIGMYFGAGTTPLRL